jgi:4-coumarate--CoA ligase
VTAAVVLAPKSKLTAEDIRAMVKQRLEDPKQLRGKVYFVEKLPRNSQGKIQRGLLRDLLVTVKS